MAFALWARKIRCPNCEFTGRAKIEGTGCGLWLLLLALGCVSFLFPPLFIVAGLMLVWLVLKPARQICPRCKHPHPIPI